jgi:hypothetical protein
MEPVPLAAEGQQLAMTAAGAAQPEEPVGWMPHARNASAASQADERPVPDQRA